MTGSPTPVADNAPASLVLCLVCGLLPRRTRSRCEICAFVRDDAHAAAGCVAAAAYPTHDGDDELGELAFYPVVHDSDLPF